jgi:hypothetical protein
VRVAVHPRDAHRSAGAVVIAAMRSAVRWHYASPPWTREWYDYCANRYRSFDPRSGRFIGYDGRRYIGQ